MKITEKYLRKIIKEELENPETTGDVVTVGNTGFGSVIKRNGDYVDSEDLAKAFGEKGEKLFSIAIERGGGSVDQDAFIEYYLLPKLFKGGNITDVAKEYASSVGAEFREDEEEYSDEDY